MGCGGLSEEYTGKVVLISSFTIPTAKIHLIALKLACFSRGRSDAYCRNSYPQCRDAKITDVYFCDYMLNFMNADFMKMSSFIQPM